MQTLPFKLAFAASLTFIFGASGIAQQTSYKQPKLIAALSRGDAEQLALPAPKDWIGAVYDNSKKGTALPEEEEELEGWEHPAVAAKLVYRAVYVMAFAERFAGTCRLAKGLPTAEIKSSLDQIRDWTAPSVSTATTTRGAGLTSDQEAQVRLNRFILDGAEDAATFSASSPAIALSQALRAWRWLICCRPPSRRPPFYPSALGACLIRQTRFPAS